MVSALKKILCFFANSLWVLSYIKHAISFRKSISNVKAIQKRVLFKIIDHNRDTVFGKERSFSAIRTVSNFQEMIPLSTYDTYVSYIDSICEGKNAVLTEEPVLLLEPSSGSTAPSKYIPYTKSLKSAFQRGIAPWIFDLFTQRTKLLFGSAYWSITPVMHNSKRTIGGVPIGFEEDAEIFGYWKQILLNVIFAVPKEVCRLSNIQNFRYVTLLFLLKNRNLTLVSVWNPTFLTLLLEQISKWSTSLVDDIKNRTISAPADIDPNLKAILVQKLSMDRKRGEELNRIFKQWKNKPVSESTLYEAIWPNLKLISCWANAHAAPGVEHLRFLFPHVEIQGKGLIATEGFVSFPLTGELGAVLAVESHFFEFIEVNKSNIQNIKLAHELEKGRYYSVVITTSGGLYRYKLQDIVEVVGFKKQCPLIRFIGKEDKISDLFGEKLNEQFISSILKPLFERHAITPLFYMVAPEKYNKEHFYTLFIELEKKISREKLNSLSDEFEKGLQQNYHYKYCLDLAQLSRSKVFIIESSGLETYHTTCQSYGQKAGDIKLVVLHLKRGWSKKFNGRFI